LPIFPHEPAQAFESKGPDISAKASFQCECAFKHYKLSVKLFGPLIVFTICTKETPSLELTVVLGNSPFSRPFNRHFRDADSFAQLLKQKKGRFGLTEEGTIAYLIPSVLARSLETGLNLLTTQRAVQENSFPVNCTGYVYAGSSYAGRGVIINEKTVITSASCVYDRRKKQRRHNLVFSLPTFRANCSTFRYPP
jgi:hypothetical protein